MQASTLYIFSLLVVRRVSMPLSLPSADPQPLAAGLYQTDAFHRQPLLQVFPAIGQEGQPHIVRSWNQAHALHGPARLDDVNPAYVAALISGNHNATEAPYARIRRLPRAHHILISRDGSAYCSGYDPFAGGAEAMPAEQLHAFLRQGLLDHLLQALEGHDGPIGCEHSSGLDSNAVLGGLRHGLGVAAERLHTWSHEWGGEGLLLGDFRRFHGLLTNHCHRLTPTEEDSEDLAGQLDTQIRLLGAPAQSAVELEVLRRLQQHRCSLLFSGLGGDQAVSHNANNVPTDLVAQGRWGELVRWTGGRRAALKIAGGRLLALHRRSWAVRRVLRRSRDLCSSNLLWKRLSPEGRAWLMPHQRENYPWEIDGYLPQHASIRHRVLADFVAVRAEEETRIAAAYGMAKAFPLLDEGLIGTLLQQDPALFGERSRRGRLLHRRAFASFLPPLLRDNPSKVREPACGVEAWRAERLSKSLQALERSLARLENCHPRLRHWWDLAAIRDDVEVILNQAEPSLREVIGTSNALGRLVALSHWWEYLDG